MAGEECPPYEPRPLAIELAEEPLDVRAIVVGTLDEARGRAAPPPTATPAVVWRGTVASDSGAKAGYYVQLQADGTGQCSCPDYYFRGVLRRATAFSCKHIRRAWAEHGPAGRKPD